eukprot:CAMPEP_0118652820 /NCGR_PEP_ID=MMETSP0785-20121206/11516_1 /TAXON_ID=91992 /ORGANISM="Bolidomonas pacifica, Strain CCMP 1866" /LENGTH=565 /DNA_ID=CAMNT_0006545351 /DNA_START=186 /DNA_END=1880 /DNA_ORIENTATION=+
MSSRGVKRGSSVLSSTPSTENISSQASKEANIQPNSQLQPSALLPLVLPTQLSVDRVDKLPSWDHFGRTPPGMVYPSAATSYNPMMHEMGLGMVPPQFFGATMSSPGLQSQPQPQPLASPFAGAIPTLSSATHISTTSPSAAPPVPVPQHSNTEEMHKMLRDAAAREVQELIESEKREEEKKRGEMNDGGGKKGKMSELEPEEKARLNRERNRAHARSTRLRKKAYVSLLSSEVARLTTEREEREQQAKVLKQRHEEDLKVRKWVLRTFFDQHVNGETDCAKWNAILSPSFTLIQPITPFRSFDRHQTMFTGNVRVVTGTEEVVDDAVSLKVMLQSLGVHNPRWLHKRLKIFSSNTPALIERLQKEKAAFAAKGTNGGVNELQVLKDQNTSLSGPPPDEGSSSPNNPAQSDGSAPPETTSTSSSSSIHQHDYNAPSIPDPPVTGNQGTLAPKKKASNPSLISFESNNSSNASAQNPASTTSSSPTSAPLPPKTAIAAMPPPLPTDNSLESRLARAPIVNVMPFSGLGKKASIPPAYASALLSSSDGTMDGSGSDSVGGGGSASCG